MTGLTRRGVLKGLGTAGTAALLAGCTTLSGTRARVVVIGGGFAGMTCARTLAGLDANLDVTLVEPRAAYIACPFSNLVVGGQRGLAEQSFGYEALGRSRVRHVRRAAVGVDPVARRVELTGGEVLDYERLVMAPGISLAFDELPGYSAFAAETMPHAWQAGEQTALLARQLVAMPDGGTVVMAIPANPYRCPPGPYERASLIAHYLQRAKPASKLLLLDAKDRFSKMGLFQAAWKDIYGDRIEWQGLSDGARVVAVDAGNMTLTTDFETVRADVANVIPPQRAGAIAITAGVADESGWCPIHAATFESSRLDGVHVIGDAAIANAMPKSAFAANAQAKLCAVQVQRLLAGRPPLATKLVNTCYSLVTPDYGISVAGVYRPEGARWLDIKGAGGTSPADASLAVRREEARYARHWFRTITAEVFG